MGYEKAKVTIDLAEYNELIKLRDNNETVYSEGDLKSIYEATMKMNSPYAPTQKLSWDEMIKFFKKTKIPS